MPSKIEWTNETWNPTTGCTKVSPGCAHCYAETLTKRYAGRPGWPVEFMPWVPGNDTIVLHPDRLKAPLSWQEPRMVFVDSMSDLFHDAIPDDYIDQVFAVMALTPQHTYQVLTKRPARMQRYLIDSSSSDRDPALVWPLSNVWLGVTVENQRWADERIPILLGTPAAVRFISAEPLLGPLALGQWQKGCDGTDPGVPGLDWVIVGGESGPKYRAFDHNWARSIVAQCRSAGVACFIKQMGGARPGNAIDDLPTGLRVREFPLSA